MIEQILNSVRGDIILSASNLVNQLQNKSSEFIRDLQHAAESRTTNADPMTAFAGRVVWNSCEVILEERKCSLKK